MMNNDKGETVLTIRAKNIEEARAQLWNEYGNDYSIISKRSIPQTGLWGLIRQKEIIEVSYIVKNRNSAVPPQTDRLFAPSVDETGIAKDDDFLRNRDEILKKNTGSVENAVVSTQISNLSKQIEELAERVKSGTVVAGSDIHPSIQRIQELLGDNEFTFGYIQEITDKLKKTFPWDDLEDFSKVQRAVVDWIGESISIAPEKVHRKPHVVILVGPTGVGKTTTLVKLATMFRRAAKKNNKTLNFCFITTDTMRVGAMEQLSRFGEVIGKNVLKAQTNEDVQKLYEEYKDYSDAIFIDTGGYGPNDAQHLADMKTMLSVQGMNPDVYLTVTASTKARDLNTIMQNYEPFGYQSVIITKCDESEQYGNVISVLHERHKSISYITNGQKITQTIAKADVVEFLKRLEGFAIDRVHIEDKFNKDDILGEQ